MDCKAFGGERTDPVWHGGGLNHFERLGIWGLGTDQMVLALVSLAGLEPLFLSKLTNRLNELLKPASAKCGMRA